MKDKGPGLFPPKKEDVSSLPAKADNDASSNTNMTRLALKRVDDEKDKHQSPLASQTFQSNLNLNLNNVSGKMRLEGSLSTGRNQSHISPYNSPSRRHSLEGKRKPHAPIHNTSVTLGNRFERPDRPKNNYSRTPVFVPPKHVNNNEEDQEEGQIDWDPVKKQEVVAGMGIKAGTGASVITSVIASASASETVGNSDCGPTTSTQKHDNVVAVANAPASASFSASNKTLTPIGEKGEKDGKGTTLSSPTRIIPTKLMCSALGDNDVSQKAINAINMLSQIIQDGSLKVEDISKSADIIPLPDTDLVTKGVQELRQQLKKAEQQQKLIKFKMRQVQEKKAKEVSEAKEEEERNSKENELRRQEAEDLRVESKNALEKLDTEKDKKKHSLSNEITASKTSLAELDGKIAERRKKIEDADMIKLQDEIMDKYESIILRAQEVSKEAKGSVDVAAKTVTELNLKLKSAEKAVEDGIIAENTVSPEKGSETDKNENAMEIVTSLDDSVQELSGHSSAVVNPSIDSPGQMKDLVRSILHRNQQRAAQTHYESINIVVSEAAINLPDVCLSSGNVPKLACEDDDSSFEQYIAHWTRRTQDVTGPGDALYSDPSQAPLYESTQKHHQEIRLLVREHVRSKKKKLHHRWTELAEEYAVREKLYEKDNKRDSNSIHSAELGGSFSICGQRRGGGGAAVGAGLGSSTNNASSLSGADMENGRATNNPYRRTRTRAGFHVTGSDIVRSDYEQEQIIAQLTAQENMEKRIKLGGSELPRQVCKLEKVSHMALLVLSLC